MQSTTSCPRCAADLDPSAAFCSTCGLPRGAIPSNDEVRRPGLVDSVLDLLRHMTLGEYDIGGRLGAGGMASVYLAHELRLNRRVAIKVMLPDLLQKEGMVERFFDEARKQARLEHRNIVPIHSMKWTAELPYFVMKFVDGYSIDDITRARGALPVPVVQYVLSGAIAALQYAHDEGVVHRDVKPGNILIDRRGEPIVSDFGIAKAAESPHLTQTGAAIGTPAYMSPEQCRAEPVTAASDQYSVGILAYQLLAGSTPFSGSALDLLMAHAASPPPPILERCPNCPPRMAAAIMRMLEKSPDDRWPALRDALPDLVDGMGSEAEARRQLIACFPDRATAAELLPLMPLSPLPPASRSPKKSAAVVTPIVTPAVTPIAAPVPDTTVPITTPLDAMIDLEAPIPSRVERGFVSSRPVEMPRAPLGDTRQSTETTHRFTRGRLGAAIAAGVVVVGTAIVFIATRAGDTPRPSDTPVSAPAAIVARPDSVAAPAGTTGGAAPTTTNPPVTNPPVTSPPETSIVTAPKAPKSSTATPPKGQKTSAATQPKAAAKTSGRETVASPPVDPPVRDPRTEQRPPTGYAEVAPSTPPRSKAVTEREAADAIRAVLALVSAERWDDVQSILQREVLGAFKDRDKLRVSLSGEPRIVESAGDGATIDFDAALTWTNLAGRLRNGQAAFRAKLARSAAAWRVTELTARAKLP